MASTIQSIDAWEKSVYTEWVSASSANAGIPLCVDLDGTLLRTDSTWEALIVLLRHKPSRVFCAPFWLLQGKETLKARLADAVTLDVSMLPYHSGFLSFLRAQKADGRRLLLVTGASRRTAQDVADHLGLFEEVCATGEGVNLTGEAKAELLVRRFGEKGFDYAGNTRADLKVWKHARQRIIVNAPVSVRRTARTLGNVEQEFEDRVPLPKALLRAMRPHQWTKNLLIFVPVMTAHRLGDLMVMEHAALAFLSFCCCTSAVYLLNDLLDLTSDRLHPRKRFRPLASGDLPIPAALCAIPVLLAAGLLLSLLLPLLFSLVLLAYFVTTLAYSWYLKQIVLVDVLVLAGLYTVRIIAGHAATGLVYSLWLLMLSLFFFFSLALVKRFSELESAADGQTVAGRGYASSDRTIIQVLGAASGLLSLLVLALYITSDQVARLYLQPELLWLIIPLMLLWMSRIWLLAKGGKVHDDPIIFTLTDRVSYLVGVLIALILFVATHVPFASLSFPL